MYSFEGEFRRKPVQCLRGASKKEPKEILLKRAQTERQKREDTRLKNDSATKIQMVFKSYFIRKREMTRIRKEFDSTIQFVSKQAKLPVSQLTCLCSQLIFFYRQCADAERLLWICQHLLSQKNEFVNLLAINYNKASFQIKKILSLCLQHLDSIAAIPAIPIALPMRMLEVYTCLETYRNVLQRTDKSVQYLVCSVYEFLCYKGYFRYLCTVLNSKVPASVERTVEPPTPVAESIFELIMRPINFSVMYKDNNFSDALHIRICKDLFCPRYSEQIGLFLLPAMAYGKYSYPTLDLIHALMQRAEMFSSESTKNYSKHIQKQVEYTPWLLCAVLTLSEKYIGKFSPNEMCAFIKVLQRMISALPHPICIKTDEDDSDSEEMLIDDEEENSCISLERIREDSLEKLDSASLAKSIVICLNQLPEPDLLTAVCIVCHTLLSEHCIPVHKFRLLYTLAFNKDFMKYLWYTSASRTAETVTGSKSLLIVMLSRGQQLSEFDVNRIIPLLSVFCAAFSHSLHTLHDTDFYGENSDTVTSMPFTLKELVSISLTLRDICLGIIELAYPDSKPMVNEDYHQALHAVASENHSQCTPVWPYIFKSIAQLVKQLHSRDIRRQFCPPDHWLATHIHMKTNTCFEISKARHEILLSSPLEIQHQSTVTETASDEGPSLSSMDVRNLIILTVLPFVVRFHERVKILQQLIKSDQENHQTDLTNFLTGPSINMMIRRNYIYEDAFDKLSRENEPNLKLKLRVQMVNTAGLDEAGIDGGGLSREFLSELLKTGFDPNRGFFSYTGDKLLYPNRQAQFLVENFTEHYYFLGRMLGKAFYENMLVELSFADFFLSKILNTHGTDLHIHHLASLDPEMYKNLLFLKNYPNDVEELGLNFTVVNNDLGVTKVVELKPGGKDIMVTNSNSIEYIHLVADYRLNKQIRPHCHAFRSGLADVLNLDWLRMFDYHELQVLISGADIPVNVDDLKQYTIYSGGYTVDHPVIRLFWDVLEEITDEQRRQLLKFVTSCSRPPLLGFKDLYPAFCIHNAGSEPDRLPTASTCMNLLKLPEFTTEQTLKTKLLYAIESGSGFELS